MSNKNTQKSSGGVVKSGGGKVITGGYKPKPGTDVRPTPPPNTSSDK